MSSLLSTTWTVLAPALDPVPEPADVKPGWVALIVVVALVSVTVLLWFSLRKQLRKVNVADDSVEPAEPGAAPGDAPSDDERGGSHPA